MISYVESMRSENPSADLAFYSLRDMSRCDWAPFLKASLERNPACIDATKDLSDDELIQRLTHPAVPAPLQGGESTDEEQPPESPPPEGWPKAGVGSPLGSDSIYDGPRLAQPDEVWNFQTGDGLEKAILLSNVWKSRHPEDEIILTATSECIELKLAAQTITFASSKGLTGHYSL